MRRGRGWRRRGPIGSLISRGATEARIKLIRQVDLTGADSRNVLQLAYLNVAFETGLKSPLDQAILEAEPVDLAGWRKLDEVPFDFERRRVSVLVERDGKRMLVVKGAPEDVLKLASKYQGYHDGESRTIDDAVRETARSVFNNLGVEGFRATDGPQLLSLYSQIR